MSSSPYKLDDPEGTEWDVVVVGNGMGGSTVGYALARSGHRVLFVEKGKSVAAGHSELPATEVNPTSLNTK